MGRSHFRASYAECHFRPPQVLLGAESLTRVPFHKSVAPSSPPLRGSFQTQVFAQVSPPPQTQAQQPLLLSQRGSAERAHSGTYETEQIRNSTITILMEENKVLALLQ